MTLNAILIDGLNKGMYSSELYPIAQKHGYQWKYKTFKNYLGNLRASLEDRRAELYENVENNELANTLLAELNKKKILKLIDVSDQYNVAPKIITEAIKNLKYRGYEISFDGMSILLDKNVTSPVKNIEQIATDDIVFGVASDLHFGSKHCQITALNEFCEECRKRGVKHILVPGDVVCGYNVYPGQLQDQYAVSAEEQLGSLLTNLPSGFEWYVLGGNHDYSFMSKGGGYNIVNAAANMRSDIHYIGFDVANVAILNNVDAMLIHPSGGVPYSASYRLQKNIEQLAYSELHKITSGAGTAPSVRFVFSGHLHIQIQGMFGNIFGAQCGCFEGQTNYLKRKGLFPHIGAYIIEASLNSAGLLKSFDAKFYMYNEIMDDYMSYSHSNIIDLKEDCIDPLF